ncbi:MAG: RES family NAD+ phosphorylase [Pseudorhodoplanes sp.]|nr:RES family NAD+ phosphorylase [Pseudorhodoplanes sp.]
MAPAPRPAYRLIPSQFPPIGLFDTVAIAADLAAVMDLVGWTNDRLVAERVARLPQSEWVYGTPNASIVMAAFLHVASGGMRFNRPELGAWYSSDDIRTAAAEVGHHLRREAIARSVPTMSRTYRTYTATLLGDYLDIRRQQAKYPDVYASDRYDASQKFGEDLRASGGAGILYTSLRRQSGTNVVAFRTRNVTDLVQEDHFEITVSATDRTINVRKLSR